LTGEKRFLKTLRATPVVLRALVRDVSDRQLRRRPAPGEWAVIEVVGHLADTEERALGRVQLMIAQDSPWLEPSDQAALAEERRYIDLDLPSELDRFGLLREQRQAGRSRKGQQPGPCAATQRACGRAALPAAHHLPEPGVITHGCQRPGHLPNGARSSPHAPRRRCRGGGVAAVSGPPGGRD
jgi:DinB superfamily